MNSSAILLDLNFGLSWSALDLGDSPYHVPLSRMQGGLVALLRNRVQHEDMTAMHHLAEGWPGMLASSRRGDARRLRGVGAPPRLDSDTMRNRSVKAKVSA